MKLQNRNSNIFHNTDAYKSTCVKRDITNRTSKKINKKKKKKNKFLQQHRCLSVNFVRRVTPLSFLFYVVFNTDLHMERGTAAAAIANGLIILYNKLEADRVLSYNVDNWIRNGRKIIILKGYNHKHLKYLHKQLKFIATKMHIVRESFGRNKTLVALIAFGQSEEFQEVFDGLTYLR